MDADYLDQLVRRGLISPDAQENMLARTMTHQAEPPNPVRPIVDAARGYLQSGDFSPVHEPGTQPRDYLRELLRNPDILARNIDQASQFNFAGMARGKSPLGITRPAFWDNPAKAALVDDLVAQGHTIQAIAEHPQVNVGTSSIVRYLERTRQKTAAAENQSTYWTPEKEAELIADYNRGMSQPALAKKHELAPGTIHSKLMNLWDRGKVDYVERGPSFREDIPRRAKFIEDVRQGYSHSELARMHGVDSRTPGKWISQLQEEGDLKGYAPQGGVGLTPAGRTPTLYRGPAQAGPAPDLDEDMAKTLAKYLKFGT